MALQKRCLLRFFLTAARQLISLYWKTATTPPLALWVSTVKDIMRMEGMLGEMLALDNNTFNKYKVLWFIWLRFSSADTLANMLSTPTGQSLHLPWFRASREGTLLLSYYLFIQIISQQIFPLQLSSTPPPLFPSFLLVSFCPFIFLIFLLFIQKEQTFFSVFFFVYFIMTFTIGSLCIYGIV